MGGVGKFETVTNSNSDSNFSIQSALVWHEQYNGVKTFLKSKAEIYDAPPKTNFNL